MKRIEVVATVVTAVIIWFIASVFLYIAAHLIRTLIVDGEFGLADALVLTSLPMIVLTYKVVMEDSR